MIPSHHTLKKKKTKITKEEDNDDEDSDIDNSDDTSHNQDNMTPPIQPIGMNINIPIPYINTMEYCSMLIC
eukprot:4586648-Ditylum_brightwellii.AAC.1